MRLPLQAHVCAGRGSRGPDTHPAGVRAERQTSLLCTALFLVLVEWLGCGSTVPRRQRWSGPWRGLLSTAASSGHSQPQGRTLSSPSPPSPVSHTLEGPVLRQPPFLCSRWICALPSCRPWSGRSAGWEDAGPGVQQAWKLPSSRDSWGSTVSTPSEQLLSHHGLAAFNSKCETPFVVSKRPLHWTPWASSYHTPGRLCSDPISLGPWGGWDALFCLQRGPAAPRSACCFSPGQPVAVREDMRAGDAVVPAVLSVGAGRAVGAEGVGQGPLPVRSQGTP
nr:uncharacterized protein LOC116155693 isoform X1 [Camelus dromedarius]